MKMGYPKVLIAIAFLLLMLVTAAATGMGPILCQDKGNEKGPSRRMEVEAVSKSCELPSSRFKGTCIRDSSCAEVCLAEGFPAGGKCNGSSSRCFCTRPC